MILTGQYIVQVIRPVSTTVYRVNAYPRQVIIWLKEQIKKCQKHRRHEGHFVA